jgi:hypothetical protein
MRRALNIVTLVAAVATLVACSREPDFDERYQNVSRTIVEKAKSIDHAIAATGGPEEQPEKVVPD